MQAQRNASCTLYSVCRKFGNPDEFLRRAGVVGIARSDNAWLRRRLKGITMTKNHVVVTMPSLRLRLITAVVGAIGPADRFYSQTFSTHCSVQYLIMRVVNARALDRFSCQVCLLTRRARARVFCNDPRRRHDQNG